MQHGNKPTLSSRAWTIVNVLVISATLLVTYYPITAVGFFAEDHVVLDEVIRLGPAEYFAYAFKQCVMPNFCRPAEDIGIWLEYLVFGNNAVAFRVVEILIHLANCMLLYGLVCHVLRKPLVAVIAALIYIGLPAASSTFAWVGSADPGVSFFYLLSIALWLRYLQQGHIFEYVFAVGAATLGLLNKEVGVAIPVALLLADRWLVAKSLKPVQLLRRYLPFAFIWAIYGWFLIQRLAAFTKPQYGGNYAGLGIGTQIGSNLLYYASLLASLGQADNPVNYLFLLLAAAIAGYLVLVKRNIQVGFVCSAAFLTLIPVLPFAFAAVRFLYLPIMASSILLASLLVRAYQVTVHRKTAAVIIASALGLLTFANASAATDSFTNLFAYTRQFRLPLRPIFQQHSNFPQNTSLYFVNSPIQTGILSGMFALRYGPGVSINGTDQAKRASLLHRKTIYLYYFNEQNQAIELPVASNDAAQLQYIPPIDFSIPVRLEGYELVNPQTRPGQAIVVLLYWLAVGQMEKDYTLFAHLVQPNGEIVAGADSQPRGGAANTSSWHVNQLIVDWLILPVPSQTTAGENYRLEFGWYYLPTMERIYTLDKNGQPVTDSLVLQPIEVME